MDTVSLWFMPMLVLARSPEMYWTVVWYVNTSLLVEPEYEDPSALGPRVAMAEPVILPTMRSL